MADSPLSKVFTGIPPEALNAPEKAVEFHIHSAMEHLRAAMHLLEAKKKRISGFSGQQFLRDAFSLLQNTRKVIPSFQVSQPDILLYTEGDLVLAIGDRFDKLEDSLSRLAKISGSGAVDVESYSKMASKLGSDLMALLSTFLGDTAEVSSEVQENFYQAEKSLKDLISITSESRFIENIRRPGVHSDLVKVYACLSSFVKAYLRERSEEREMARATEQTRKRRVARASSSTTRRSFNE